MRPVSDTPPPSDFCQMFNPGSPGTLEATLPPAQSEVLLLRVVADLSVDEVASIVGKRPTAVRALQHRAVVGLARRAAREEAAREEKSESSP